ncbi:hypothetical protein VC83_01869 [Pseudogymnoascus destructans]|uniref:Uncharacterized protein n=1 Tax=Pseudogymnoascus destructans TaxID=655981 RepID=A0A177AIS4_9PEZI|nr:uncharacterized protein VC83_01869 [Pseudogymnoascus destructans]OAF61690.2 hypothetical protein VC83_01869 [Pseudogymnoascus destructans]
MAQTAKQNQLQKASGTRDKMPKQVEIFLPKTSTESQMPHEASERWAKRTTMRDVPKRSTSEKERDQYYAKLREKNIEEANKAAINMLEEQLNSAADEPWILKARKWLRAAQAKEGEPQNTLFMTSEPGVNVGEWLRTAHTKKEELKDTLSMDSKPKVNPATAAFRKQYAEIQSKISPAKTATPKIRWTPNLPIPPPDGPDSLYVKQGFSSAPPRVSQEQLKKRKREEKKREMEERMMDEALDTEMLPKPKRGKRLNEFEEAMRVAGMCPEDPEGKPKGRGRGRGGGEKGERPWEGKGKRGRGRGRGRGGLSGMI